MPTAIARIYTDEGFVIAADGRAQNSVDGSTDDETQKIFVLNKPGVALAYSLAGVVGIGPKDTSRVFFNFYRAFSRATQVVGDATPETLYEYVGLLANEVHGELFAAIRGRNVYFLQDDYLKLDGSEDGSFAIVHIWFDGYYRGFASKACLKFWHRNQRLQKYKRRFDDNLDPGELDGYGSREIRKRLRANSFTFREYRLPLQTWTDRVTTLPDAITLARGFVAAHASQEALKIDEAMCSAVGGHIHVATVTPKGGAQWAIAPKGI